MKGFRKQNEYFLLMIFTKCMTQSIIYFYSKYLIKEFTMGSLKQDKKPNLGNELSKNTCINFSMY